MMRLAALCAISLFLLPLPLNRQGGSAREGNTTNEVMKMPRGKVLVQKKVEEVTANDVMNAFQLKGVADGVPVVESIPKGSSAPFVITGEGLGMIPGYYDVASTTQTRLGKTVKVKQGFQSSSLLDISNEHARMMLEGDNLKRAFDTSNNSYRHIDDGSYDKVVRLLQNNKATLKTIGMYNAQLIKDLPSNCAGLKLRKVYAVLPGEGGVNLEKPASFAKTIINLKRDFLIDGEVKGKAVGGIYARWGLFYTEHSLNLRKMLLLKQGGSNWSIFVNCATNVGRDFKETDSKGVDQLKVEGCVFQGFASTKGDPTGEPNAQEFGNREGRQYAGKFIYLYFKDKDPWRNGKLEEGNRLKNLLVKDNFFFGAQIIRSDRARFTDSYRFVRNCIFAGYKHDNYKAGFWVDDNEGFGSAAELVTHATSTQNGLKMAYHSCPMWFVENKFHGADRILAKRNTYSQYYCALLLEGGTAYVLGNTIKNFVSKQTVRVEAFSADTTQAPKHHHAKFATYDIYASVVKLYYANNSVSNVLTLSYARAETTGVLKAKNLGVPYAYRPGWRYEKTVRYFSNSTFTIDREWVQDKWDVAVTQGEAYHPEFFRSGSKSTISQWRLEDEIDPKTGKVRETDTKYEKNLKKYDPAVYQGLRKGEKWYDRRMGENLDDFITTNLQSVVMSHKPSAHDIVVPVNDYTFINNTFDMGNTRLGGMKANGKLICVNFTCHGNTFKAAKISSDRWKSTAKDPSVIGFREALFVVVPWNQYGAVYEKDAKTGKFRRTRNGQKPSIKVSDNKFVVGDYVEGGRRVRPTDIKLLFIRKGISVPDYKVEGSKTPENEGQFEFIFKNNTVNKTTDQQANTVSYEWS
ncbi:MAG: hypothetical protein J5529_06000 [Prevotella sp.]|nr:hypothetical protein [Prevotella sp.]